MSKSSIYLALPPDLNGPWAYMDAASLDGANGSVQWAKTEAQKMALSAKELTLILPGENIIRRAIDLPGIRGRELKSAIEFDLEDRIGGSMSDEFMCMDRKRPGHVALLSNNYKMQLSTLLEKYELNPERIYIDFELIGAGQNLSVGERLLKGGVDGYALDSAWRSLMSEPLDFTPLEPQALFTHFHAGLKGDDMSPLNLRHSLGVKTANDFDWQPWAKYAGLIAAVIVLPFMFDKYSEARALSAQAKIDRTAARDLYKQVTGKASQDPARSISRQLKAGTSSAGFLDMSGALFAAMGDVDGVEIDTMRYDPRQNLLQLSIRYPNFEAGELLEQAVLENGGRLAVGGIRERGDALIGEASFVLAQGGRS